MNTIFMNSRNSKTSDPHRLSPNLLDKIDLKKWQICCFIKSYIYFTLENIKKDIQKRKIQKIISKKEW